MSSYIKRSNDDRVQMMAYKSLNMPIPRKSDAAMIQKTLCNVKRNTAVITVTPGPTLAILPGLVNKLQA